MRYTDKNTHRRTVTFTGPNIKFINNIRGETILKNRERDFTTVLNSMLAFAIEKGFIVDNA